MPTSTSSSHHERPQTGPRIEQGPIQVSNKLRVILVDDHPITRQGMRAMIGLHPEFEIVGEAAQASAAVELIARVHPEIAIVDITLKDTNGIELTKNIRALAPETRVLIASMHDETMYAERALRAGAVGYLMKHETSERLIDALRDIVAGRVYLSTRMKEAMLHRFVHKRAESATFSVDSLSDREFEVLQLIGNGFGTREIAERLKLSTKTIDSYREHVKKKLGLTTGADVVRFAIELVRTGDI